LQISPILWILVGTPLSTVTDDDADDFLFYAVYAWLHVEMNTVNI